MAEELLINRVLGVFELMAAYPSGLRITEIASRLRLPKSAAHRMLIAMVGQGFVLQDELSERYRLTLKLTAIGFRYLAETKITEVCQPVLDRLASRTGELVRMTLVDSESLIWVAKAQGALTGLRYDPDMGHPVVLHATSTGKAWLSTLDEEEAVRIVRARGFDVPARFHRPVVCNEADLRKELRRTRKRGYGLAIEEGEAGTAALGVAIISPPRGKAVGTVSIAGPISRLSPKRLEELSGEVIAAAEELAFLWPLREFSDAARPTFPAEHKPKSTGATTKQPGRNSAFQK
jgi:IclR family acetate operon transcriptional repressor